MIYFTTISISKYSILDFLLIQVLVEHVYNKIKDKVTIKLNAKVNKVYWDQNPIQIEVS